MWNIAVVVFNECKHINTIVRTWNTSLATRRSLHSLKFNYTHEYSELKSCLIIEINYELLII